MSKNWLRLLLIIAVLAVNLGFTVGSASAQTTYATYVVQPGDTLGKIAAKYCTTWTVIYNLNRNVIYNPNVIYPGMVLTVPLNCSGNDGGGPVPGTCVDNGARLHANGYYAAPYYTVAWGDTLYSTGKRFGIAWQSIASANGITYSYIYAGQRLYIPCSGTVPPPPPPSNTTRITFPAGSNSASAAGTTSNSLPANYILTAQAGQTMTVQTTSRTSQPLVVSITGPGGALTLSGPNSQTQNIVSASLPSNGDYTVTVRPAGTTSTSSFQFDIVFSIP
jgi:LysM repeat protein